MLKEAIILMLNLLRQQSRVLEEMSLSYVSRLRNLRLTEWSTEQH